MRSAPETRAVTAPDNFASKLSSPPLAHLSDTATFTHTHSPSLSLSPSTTHLLRNDYILQMSSDTFTCSTFICSNITPTPT